MINPNKHCTACGACEQVCPQKCVHLSEDENGFVYPIVENEKCIGCNLCDKVCHLNCEFKVDKENQFAYAVAHVMPNIVKESTSGGAFTAISDYVFSKGGVVYGCAYDESVKPVHIRVDKAEDLAKLRGSKYVQSEIANTYLEAKEDLESGKLVFYTGTPCQIAGLKGFLRKEYDNLITADLICHGVPSYAYFAKFLKWYSSRLNAQVCDFNFRAKANKKGSYAGVVSGYRNNSNKPFTKKIAYYDSYYYHYFLESDVCRESCYECKYANLDRPGDFTMGDLWGVEGLDLPFDTRNGCSVLLINSPKAKDIYDTLDILAAEVDLDFVVKNNKQLKEPTKKSAIRDELIEENRKCSAGEIQKRYKKRYKLARFKAKAKYALPRGLKNLILKIRYRNKK